MLIVSARKQQQFIMSTSPAHDSSDILPLPESLKRDLQNVLIGRFGSHKLGPDQFEVLWQMICSATWEYRQTAPINKLDVQATLNQANKLQSQTTETLGLTVKDFEFIAMAMIRLESCAGFFGLYRDRWMLTSLSEV